jgi:molecular chaperone HscB
MDPFATLGLPRRYDLDLSELEQQYRNLQRTLHPDRHVGASASERRMTLGKAVEVNEAYRVLRDDIARAEALLSAQAKQDADPALLMEVMELREALSEAKHARDTAAVRKLAEQVLRSQEAARTQLTAAFASSEQGTAAACVSKLKYYRRFLDEVRVIEDEAQG